MRTPEDLRVIDEAAGEHARLLGKPHLLEDYERRCEWDGCHDRRMNSQSPYCPTHALLSKNRAHVPQDGWACDRCRVSSPRQVLERWSISRCPGCGRPTGVPVQHKAINRVLTDPKLIAKVRDLIRREHAGFLSDGHRCVEPGCSCEGGVSRPFREKPGGAVRSKTKCFLSTPISRPPTGRIFGRGKRSW